MTVTGFQNPDDQSFVSWSCDGTPIVKNYPSTVYAVELLSHDGVVIVEPYTGSPHNAVIYDCDGRERVRLVNPLVKDGAISFVYPYYVGTELTLVSAMPGLQFGVVFDENGVLQRVYETR